MKKKILIKTLIVIVLLLSFSFGADEGAAHNIPQTEGNQLIDKLSRDPVIPDIHVDEESFNTLLGLQNVISDIAKNACPSVVNIHVLRSIEYVSAYNEGSDEGFAGSQITETYGSGFIYPTGEYVVTNYHVVEGALEIKIIDHNQRSYNARIFGFDRFTDIALIKIQDSSNLLPVRINTKKNPEVGDFVVAMGTPFGLGISLSLGIISGLNRDFVGNTYSSLLQNFIQTDASINRGHSGGPLFNIYGEVIGVNTAIYSYSGESEGVAFAIPSDIMRSIIARIIAFGKVSRAYIGLGLIDVDISIAQELNLPETEGVFVDKVFIGSPANRAGIFPGDIIITVDDEKINSRSEFIRLIKNRSADEKVNLLLMRQNTMINIEVILDDEENFVPDGEYTEYNGELIFNNMGLVFADRSTNSANNHDGVCILDVDENSPSSAAGLEKGDCIISIDRKLMSSPDDVRNYFIVNKNNGTFFLRFYRDGQIKMTVIEVEN